MCTSTRFLIALVKLLFLILLLSTTGEALAIPDSPSTLLANSPPVTSPPNKIHSTSMADAPSEPHRLFPRHNYAVICTTRDPATGLDREDIRLSRICLRDPYKHRCSKKGIWYTNFKGGDGQAHEACDSFCECRNVLPKPRCLPLGGGGNGVGD